MGAKPAACRCPFISRHRHNPLVSSSGDPPRSLWGAGTKIIDHVVRAWCEVNLRITLKASRWALSSCHINLNYFSKKIHRMWWLFRNKNSKYLVFYLFSLKKIVSFFFCLLHGFNVISFLFKKYFSLEFCSLLCNALINSHTCSLTDCSRSTSLFPGHC